MIVSVHYKTTGMQGYEKVAYKLVIYVHIKQTRHNMGQASCFSILPPGPLYAKLS